jgi:hypothetical protein
MWGQLWKFKWPTVFYNILYLLKYQIVPNQLYYNKKIMTKLQEKTLEVSLITFFFNFKDIEVILLC